jgi:glycosyltransferase involved in cell wall biosynthesis
VSQGQAAKVRRAGIGEDKITVIYNAIRPERFVDPDPVGRDLLRGLFLQAANPLPRAPEIIVGAAGRLSREKGFGVLVDAAATVLGSRAKVHGSPCGVGFILFGDGPLRESLERQIAAAGLEGRFILAGFRSDLDRLLPNLDLMVLPSFSEGLPNVALEALAAGVPVVATAVGGTPEVIEDGQTGYLVPPGDAAALAGRMLEAISDPAGRSRLTGQGRGCVATRFSFDAQAASYRDLFRQLSAEAPPATIAEAQAEAAREVRAAS